LSELDPNPEQRLATAERLARLCEGELRDPKGAIGAWRKLLGSARELEALAALERLYAATGAQLEVAGGLGKRAGLETGLEGACAIARRATELWSKSGDRAAALGGWRRFVETFGPSREGNAEMIPLLEQERSWNELAAVLVSEATLATGPERAQVLAKLA